MDNKVLDEAVEAALAAIRAEELQVFGGYKTPDNGARRETMRAALLAGVKVLLGEPVAWQRRIRASESHWSDWEEWIDMYGYGMQPKIGRWDAEYRPVYAPSLGEGDE